MHAFDPPLGTIDEEAALCRKACADLKVGDYVWHCHHETLFEALTEPVKYRIAYILAEKPTRERAARLRLLRPGPPELAALYADYRAKRDALYAEAKCGACYADYQAKRDALHAASCPNCPWDGETIADAWS